MNDAPSPVPDSELPGLQSLALASVPTAGHFDELRRAAADAADQLSRRPSTPSTVETGHLAVIWEQFFDHLGNSGPADMDQRTASLEHQLRDNGVTYNVYADGDGPQRPWSLDLFPLIIDSADWQQIESGVLQRIKVLERVMADVYGPQQLLALGLLPPALVHGHPGYLRAMQGVLPAGSTYLHVTAFDLARGPDGNWWVVGQRCQAPSGLGYLLENRLAISNQFPLAFEAMRVQRLAGTYRALMDSLKQLSPAGADAHLALLTPGPYNETYFEHAYLARYLGLTLVEGSDLIVRDERVYLKTLKGLVRVHGLLKRVDDEFLDPLELRADSTLGIPGLLQAVRAGHVLMANAPGAAFLESPALLGFLPALCKHLLGEELQLPALPTWWCGEKSALDDVLPKLGECVVKPTYPDSPVHTSFETILGHTLSPREIDECAGRIVRNNEEHTVQAYMPLSQLPTWQAASAGAGPTAPVAGKIVPRSVMLRVFAVSDGQERWRILPGGLARVAGASAASADIASMQQGGSSADVWALTRGEVDKTTLLQTKVTPAMLAQRKRFVTSRAAENLYWLGRYTERTENALRLARLTLECLNGEDQSSQPLLAWLGKMAVANTLVLPTVPSALQARRVFERSMISSLGSTEGATSVGFYLRALKMAAATVRERLSQELWRVIVRAEDELFSGCKAWGQSGDYSSREALLLLKNTSDHMAAITGGQTDRMTRDDGWRLLSIGRHIERLDFLSNALLQAFETASVHTVGGFEALIALFDSTITFHAQYQQSRDVAALIDLLVLDRDNPRSLAWVAHTLRGRLAKLAGREADKLSALSLRVPDPALWDLAKLCETFDPPVPAEGTGEAPGYFFALNAVLMACSAAAFEVSEEISATYFTHSGQSNQSLGT